jgi:tetratricopeptide (TPR) repeat protein
MWIYKFRRGSWREGVMERNDSDAGHNLARQVGVFMERFLVPRSKTFIPRTARVYAEHGAANRAGLMRSLALTNDNADVWGLGYDLTRFYDEIAWPDALRRTLYMNLLERLLSTGNLQVADQVHTDGTAWATKQEDRDLTAWMLYTGSRIDARRQDLYRARDRGRDALKLYEALGNDARRAEVLNHLAAVELQDGNPNAAIENVNEALKAGQIEGPDGKPAVLPQVFANAEHIRGLVARQSNRLQEAAEHFRRANEVAGQMGIAGLALDAGLAFGEALLAGGQVDKARDILDRVVQIATGMQNANRERAARELLAQAEGALRHYDQAVANASRVLQLSQALRFDHTMPIDLFNLGYFNLQLQKPTEALVFFKQSAERLQAAANHPFVKDLWFHMGQAHLQVGNDEDARQSLRSCLRPTQQAKDWKRMVTALEQLAGLEIKRGSTNDAKKLLADAIVFAERANLREERKALRRKLDQLG